MAKGIAAKVAGWQKKYGGRGFTGYQSASGATATSVTGLKIEIFIDESWVDISKDVRYASRVVIAGGRSDESSQVQRGTCKFSLNNRDGKYSPRNPSSPLYGKIGRNTPIRCSTEQEGTVRYRFYGEIVAWPSKWDVSDTDIFVPVEGSGILRRLNQGVRPSSSSMYRTITKETIDHIVAYWPCEDASGSTSIASGLSNAASMTTTGIVNNASYAGFAASDSIITLGVGNFTGAVPPYTLDAPDANGLGPHIKAHFLLHTPSGGSTENAVIFQLHTTGTVARWEARYITAFTGSLLLTAYNSAGTILATSDFLTDSAIDGKDVLVTITIDADSSPDIFAGIGLTYADGTAAMSVYNMTIAGGIPGAAIRVVVAPVNECSDMSIGHIWIQTDGTANLDTQVLLDGHKGESALARISRLCLEEGINFSGTDVAGNDTTMGTQNPNTLVNLMVDCAKTDVGLLYETRDQLGIGYRPRPSLYNQDPKLTLSYATNDLLNPAAPIDDDQQTRNNIEVKRLNGSSARITQDTGILSVLPPPDGVGLYDFTDTFNLETDTQIANLASWLLHLGTTDEPRYPELDIHLQRNTFANSYDLTAAALTIGIGDRILITDQPSHEGPGDVDVLVQAYTETIDQFEHRISFNGAPNSPWQIAVADGSGEFVSRADTDGTTLYTGISSSETTLVLQHTSPTDKPFWGNDDVPFDITLGGEVVTVTAVNGFNYGFESGVSDWTGTNCTNTQSATHTLHGDFANLVTVTGSPTQAFTRPTSANRPSVVPGTTYTVGMWVYSVAGYADIGAAIDWEDAAHSYITTTSTSNVVPASQWKYITASGPAVANSAYVRYGPTIGSSPAAGTELWVEDVLFSPYVTQNVTVTRSVNGIVKTHPAGTSIELTHSAIASL